MNTRKFLLATSVLILLATSTSAQTILPGPNALGLYFDGEAQSVTMTLDSPATVDIYLIFTNPTIDFINAWEIKVTISSGAAITGVALPSGSSTVLNGPSEWSVVMSEPMPCNPLTKLAVFSVASEAQDETLFFLGAVDAPTLLGSDLPAVRLTDGTWLALPIITADPLVAVAGINSVTADEATTWGSVKSLFR